MLCIVLFHYTALLPGSNPRCSSHRSCTTCSEMAAGVVWGGYWPQLTSGYCKGLPWTISKGLLSKTSSQVSLKMALVLSKEAKAVTCRRTEISEMSVGLERPPAIALLLFSLAGGCRLWGLEELSLLCCAETAELHQVTDRPNEGILICTVCRLTDVLYSVISVGGKES